MIRHVLRLRYPKHANHARRLSAPGFLFSRRRKPFALLRVPGCIASERSLAGSSGEYAVIGFLINRIVYSLGVLVAVATAIFVLIHLGGDPTAGFTAPGASPEQQASIREQFGLNRPLPDQYAIYLSHAVRGDFGDSWRARRPAMDAVVERLPATLALTATALIVSIMIGAPLGLVAGQRQRGPGDYLAQSFAVAGQAIPGFILGTLLILLFAVRLRWLPSSGGEGVRSIVLPALALAAYPAAIVARLLRSSLMETLSADYIRTAYAKGLSRRVVTYGHALKNAILPTLAFFGLQAGFLIGGAVIIEGVFAYPGIGQLALNAVVDRDLPVIQAVALAVAIIIIAVNLAIDIAARTIDPRLRDSDGVLQ
jgi:peptide/nickel transport system permease protein